ncbi:LytTR family transcriptional regulator [Lacihabitans sp. LS3-19]|uniref:LytTR family DNA-binding domain-containing protein n=1 Tax=Lacihabitans sp. LS3-19 TaxID=2487335 RepID=UPI0020CD2773|nr:LytTR family DNA-binding domain-containing protein [Lacihabitans sp. LS3-19]MCP9768218.1 LytTR family transcriptional regulator [Lacihabitans sp. LS3-19]
MEYYYLKKNDAVEISQLVLLEAIENYTLFHLNDGSKLISSSTLKRHQENLCNSKFLRVNRSMLINSQFIVNTILKKDTHFIRLQNGKEIRVSRRRVDTIVDIAS